MEPVTFYPNISDTSEAYQQVEKKLIFSNRRLNRSEISLQSGCLRLFVHSAVELLLCMAVQQEEEEEEQEQEKKEEEEQEEQEEEQEAKRRLLTPISGAPMLPTLTSKWLVANSTDLQIANNANASNNLKI